MKTVSYLLICLVTGLLRDYCTAANEQPEKQAADTEAGSVSQWSSISYPVMSPWRKWITLPKLVPTIRVENKGKDGMEVALRYFLPSELEQKKTGKVAPETVTASLYRNEGMAVPLKGTFSSEIYVGSGPDLQYRELDTIHAFTIPWGLNAFDDAWVRLDLKDRTFWVELPYGFTRKPDDPPAPADTKRAAPTTTPFKKGDFTPEDIVIPWEYVSYRLEKFREGGCTVHMANTFYAMTELRLFSGNVREPECSVKAVLLPGYERTGRCISLILDKSDPVGWQMFRFPMCPDDSRRLCQVEVTVAGVKRKLSVPSSLLYSRHGHASLPEGAAQLEIAEKWRSG